MENFYQNIKNMIDFNLRKVLNFSRKNYFEPPEPKINLFKKDKEIERESFLLEKYNFEKVKNESSKINYLENLCLLDILDKYLNTEKQDYISVLDIGAKNWSYVKAEYYFFVKYSDSLLLNGIELDTNRLYQNFYSRKEVAKFHIKDLKNTNYLEGDFLKHEGKYDYIIWILPFIKKYPHLKWGLPIEYFKPNEMLEHAMNSLKEKGQLVIINQGKEEFEIHYSMCGRNTTPNNNK